MRTCLFRNLALGALITTLAAPLAARTIPAWKGANPDTFDAELRACAPGEDIYLEAGTYKTRGYHVWYHSGGTQGFYFKSGWKIHGQGMYYMKGSAATVIQLVNARYAPPSGTYGAQGLNYVVSTYEYDPTGSVNGLIENLTIDCNYDTISVNNYPWPATPNTSLSAVHLTGTGNVIRNVEVKRASGERANAIGYDEQFLIEVRGLSGSSQNNVIEGCNVHTFRNPSGNGACSAIHVAANAGTISAVVRSNIVSLNNYIGEFAYNMGGNGYGVQFLNNTSMYARRGFNNDTGSNAYVTVRDNYFYGTWPCIGLLVASCSNSTFERNWFDIPGNGQANGNNSLCVMVVGPGYPGSTGASYCNFYSNTFNNTGSAMLIGMCYGDPYGVASRPTGITASGNVYRNNVLDLWP